MVGIQQPNDSAIAYHQAAAITHLALVKPEGMYSDGFA